MIRQLLVASLLVACTGTIQTVPPPAGPAPAAPPPVAPPPTVADHHPAYMHAIADLRAARAYLEKPAGASVKWDEKIAIGEIDQAIHTAREAAAGDDRDAFERPSIDAVAWGGRLQKAAELLDKAREDISQEEDNLARGVQRQRHDALEHIANAERAVKEGMRDAEHAAPPPPPVVVAPPAHPAYLHALADLRQARALLAKPAAAEVKWDESKAVKQIDEAIKEIRAASIDDNKAIDDHPAIDVAMKHRDRLRAALELLGKSAKDIEEHEDNAFAKGLRTRAAKHIRDAEKWTREAVEDRKGH